MNRNYLAIYKNKRIEVTAPTSYEAQQKAAELLKARKRYDVNVYLADITHTAVD